jgi:hypothetical protein
MMQFKLSAACAAFGIALLSTTSSATSSNPRCSWLLHPPASSPTARAAMATAYDPISQKVVIFSGFDASTYLQETWTYDGSAWMLESPPNSPPARAGAMMAYDAPTQKIVLFGGFDGANYLDDTWLWDGATSTWTNANPSASPPPVTGSMLFTDPLNGHVDKYGGFKPPFYTSSMYQWTGTTWQPLNPTTTPSARAASAVALDRQHHNVVLFGGLGSIAPTNTWTWDGNNWMVHTPATQPPLRFDSSAAFEPHLGNVVLFGGGSQSDGSALDDTWRWTGTDWQQLTPVHTPTPRDLFALAYDDAIGSLVLFGGSGAGGLLDDTWWFAVRP